MSFRKGYKCTLKIGTVDIVGTGTWKLSNVTADTAEVDHLTTYAINKDTLVYRNGKKEKTK